MLDHPSPSAGDRFGQHVHVVDLDQDGHTEIIVGAPGRDVGATPNAGTFFIRIGPNGPSSGTWLEVPEPLPGGPQSGADFGYRLDSGDFNFDGFVDLVVSAPDALFSGAPIEHGELFVLLGPWNLALPTPYTTAVQVTEPLLERNDTTHVWGDRFGHRLAVGDFNGDGFDDLLAGAPWSNVPAPGGQQQAGQAWVYWGDVSGVNTASPLELKHPDEPLYVKDRLWGFDVAAGNIVDDGHVGLEDAIVAAYNVEPANSGNVAVFTEYPINLFNPLVAERVYQQGGPAGNACFGWAIDVGNYNGDALLDLAVGAPDASFGAGGEVHIYFGGVGPGAISPGPDFDAPVSGLGGGDFGHEVTWVDKDGDGIQELAVGAPTFNPPPGIDPSKGVGRVFLRAQGPPPAWTVFDDPSPEETTEREGFGHAIAAGFINANGREDMVIGNQKANNYSGEVRVVLY